MAPAGNRCFLAFAGVAFLVALVGCSSHLAGTNDAAIEYRIDPEAATGKTEPRLLAARVKARLSAGQIMAEVRATDGAAVRVVVDADAADTVDNLVLWQGGLLACLMRDGKQVGPPAVELGVEEPSIQSIDLALRGRALTLGLTPHALDSLVAARSAYPDARVAFIRGRAMLATLPFDQAFATPLVIPLGDSITAYGRAHRARRLIASPVLPSLLRASIAPLPPRWGLATACAVLPFLLSLAWLLFVRRFDRARPEPVWLVLATFAIGGLSIVPAGLVEHQLSAATPWLDPSVATLGGQLWALPLAMLVSTLVVGIPEEGAKLLSVWVLARRRREFDEPVDGIVYASAAALGFAAMENVKYFAFGRMSGTVIALRGFMTVPAHMLFSALWGYAMGQALVSRRSRVLAFAGLAAFAHGLFDALLSTDGMQVAAAALILALSVAFIFMLQRSLRHGAVRVAPAPHTNGAPAPASLPASLRPREYFRVGSRPAFVLAAASMIASAFAMTVLGTAYEMLHHRVGFVFVGVATAVLGLLGVAARAASSTIPLDVVVDADGVTFAGACTPWGAIAGVDVEARHGRWFVELRTARGGPIRLGPASEGVAEGIAAALLKGMRR